LVDNCYFQIDLNILVWEKFLASDKQIWNIWLPYKIPPVFTQLYNALDLLIVVRFEWSLRYHIELLLLYFLKIRILIIYKLYQIAYFLKNYFYLKYFFQVDFNIHLTALVFDVGLYALWFLLGVIGFCDFLILVLRI